MIIPMLFTCIRILITPYIWYSITLQQWHHALILFFIGVITDFFDGFFARYLKQASFIGAILDPVADKLFLLSLFFALSQHASYLPAWILFIILAKELAIIVGAVFLLVFIPGFKVVPLWSAKVVTAYEFVALLFMLLFHAHIVSISEHMLYVSALGCVLVSLWVLLQYAANTYTLLRKHNAF